MLSIIPQTDVKHHVEKIDGAVQNILSCKAPFATSLNLIT